MIDKTSNMEKMNVSCGIIKKDIDNIPHILLIQRSRDDHWPLHFEPPRGKCDRGKNESLKHCLIREVKEETGLDVKPIMLIDKFKYINKEKNRISTQYNFLCSMVNPNQKVKLSKEHMSYKWISSVGEAELMLLPETKKTISKVLNKKKISNESNKLSYKIVENYLERII